MAIICHSFLNYWFLSSKEVHALHDTCHDRQHSYCHSNFQSCFQIRFCENAHLCTVCKCTTPKQSRKPETNCLVKQRSTTQGRFICTSLSWLSLTSFNLEASSAVISKWLVQESFHNQFKIFWYGVLLKMRGIFWFYLYWGTANWHLNWQHSIIWTAILVQQHWELEL